MHLPVKRHFTGIPLTWLESWNEFLNTIWHDDTAYENLSFLQTAYEEASENVPDNDLQKKFYYFFFAENKKPTGKNITCEILLSTGIW